MPGADPNSTGTRHGTPRLVAVVRNDVPMAALSLAQGAEQRRLDRTGKTAVSIAQQFQDARLQSLLTGWVVPQ